MKKLILILASLTMGSMASAGSVLKVKSKNFTCSELQELVQEEGTVHIKWIGSLDVHASASACNGRRLGEELVPFQTTWKTIDKSFCVAGYSCRIDHNDRR